MRRTRTADRDTASIAKASQVTVCLAALRPCCRYGAAGAESADSLRIKFQFSENHLVVLAKFWCALGRQLGYVVPAWAC